MDVNDSEKLKKYGKFKMLSRTSLEDISDGLVETLTGSDLTIQTSTHIVQFAFEDYEEEEKKYIIKPGTFTMVDTDQGTVLEKLELKTHNLLESATNTALIRKEAETFFSKIDTYKKYKKDPKRAILLYSGPGMGKSSTISKIAKDFTQEDPGTVVIFWDTSAIRSSTVSYFLSVRSKFSKKCTRLLFVMEDIGGGNVEEYHGPKNAEASLLELLDGASVSFSLPTFIIATTNTPENLLQSLADRPGRFDQMFELEPPSAEERAELVRHIACRDLTAEEVQAVKDKSADGLSIAHLSEIVIRSDLHNKTFKEVIEEMKNHKKKIEAAFQKVQKKMGLS